MRDDEWGLVQDLLSVPGGPAGRGRRPEVFDQRDEDGRRSLPTPAAGLDDALREAAAVCPARRGPLR
ncbi:MULTISPECIES: ferredoxin [Streptomyces]|uniref:Transposase n=1 Tax=Streptomyces edwardsiae TaxID=3075527 RepID=A0ABU2QLA4_9ACTN|nr:MULTISPECIES: hypothetical protein [unclassified Streptomyces]MDT0405249.1 hypothetical protein [Streptomyces sp. DSM 41635]